MVIGVVRVEEEMLKIDVKVIQNLLRPVVWFDAFFDPVDSFTINVFDSCNDFLFSFLNCFDFFDLKKFLRCLGRLTPTLFQMKLLKINETDLQQIETCPKKFLSQAKYLDISKLRIFRFLEFGSLSSAHRQRRGFSNSFWRTTSPLPKRPSRVPKFVQNSNRVGVEAVYNTGKSTISKRF